MRRSDSNGEDLEGYAGAGLYESITMDTTTSQRVDYSDDPITVDAEYRRKVWGSVEFLNLFLKLPSSIALPPGFR